MKLATICALVILTPGIPVRPFQVSSQVPGGGPTQSNTARSPVVPQDQTEESTITETPEEQSERFKLPFKLAPERICVKAPEGEVPLGNPLEITISFAPGRLADLSSGQRSFGNSVYQSSGPARVVREAGNTKTIVVVPAQLRPVDLDIAAAYADNAVATQTVQLDVVPSAEGLKSFVIDGGNTAMPLVLEDK